MSELFPMRKHNFVVLDGLRGVAAIAVLIAHASSIVLGHAIFERKYMAVQFFFMLSGFVVMCAYETKLKSGMSFGQFCMRRIIRLYPLIWISTLLGWIYLDTFDISFSTSPDRFVAIALSSLSLPVLYADFKSGIFPINPPEWSLYFELIAYGCFGLFAHRTSTRTLFIVAAAGVGSYAAVALQYPANAQPFWCHAFGILASFPIGMLLWRSYKAGRLPQISVPFLPLAIAMLFICAIPKWRPAIIDAALIAFIFPAMILLGANFQAPKLQSVLKFLGELSYPLYILH